MKVLLIGANGQLGWELQRTCPGKIKLSICDFPQIDFLNSQSIAQCIETSGPDCIINAAAYTAVDKAETDKNTAYRINHLAVKEMAKHCEKEQIFLVHISTDFVFDGTSHKPYLPSDTPNPVSVYGDSKLRGENAIRQILEDQSLIIRTAWLYSGHGANFVKTMVSLMNEKESLTVIDEQVGTPTWALGLAKAIWQAVLKKMTGIYHWTDAGVASWYDFAIAIQEEAFRLKLVSKSIPIKPVPAKAFPTPAQRPQYSVLDKTSFWQALGITGTQWRVNLRNMLKEYKKVLTQTS